jgi:penicillin-binding protein 1A
LAGKTGTSSEAVDGWFAGYSGNITAVAWMGFDEPQSLGGREFGATLALPIWMDYMTVALKGRPPYQMPQPAGVSQIQGDWVWDEFQGDAAVRFIDLDLLDRLKDLMGVH